MLDTKQASLAIDPVPGSRHRADTQRDFPQQLRAAFDAIALEGRAVTVAREGIVYSRGQHDSKVYLLLAGMIKLVHVSPEGKVCVTGLHAPGELFGECTLRGPVVRDNAAVAIAPSLVLAAPADALLRECSTRGLLPGLVALLTARMLDQQGFISSLLTVNCQRRLARVLLEIGRKSGRRNGDGHLVTIPLRHAELAEMVGTSRSRIGEFLKDFVGLGWCRIEPDSSIAVDERHLAKFSGQSATAAVVEDERGGTRGKRSSRPTGTHHDAATVVRRLDVRAGRRERPTSEARSHDAALETLDMPSIAYSLQALGRRHGGRSTKRQGGKKSS